jgi:phospholipase C
MKHLAFGRIALSSCVAAAMLAGCGASQPPIGAPGAMPQRAAPISAKVSLQGSPHERRFMTTWPLAHLIIVVQQDRSFDDLFAGYPGADAPMFGCAGETSSRRGAMRQAEPIGWDCPPRDSKVPLKSIGLTKPPCDIGVSFARYFLIAWDDGEMDGWNRLDQKHPDCPYTRVRGSDTRGYWSLAKRFALADHMFSSARFGKFADDLYLIAGTTEISPYAYVIGPPRSPTWGCDAPPGSRTRILRGGRVGDNGPFPCFDQFPTMANLFDKAGVSWKCYYNAPGRGGLDWNPFEAIQYVFEGPDWSRDMSAPATNVLSDVADGNLDSVSWVLSPPKDSDAPGTAGGPRWVNAIVRAVKKSAYWPNTAIVIIWDTEGSGQFYDNVAPPQLDFMGLGFRVPMIVVSPYAKHGYVSHTEYEFGSILKFIEQNWSLPYLGGGATDQRANSIADAFDFKR